MRKWVSAAIVIAALVPAQTALADTPPEVYNDFAADGVLSCGHSRSALKAALSDASIQQYGDPLTFLGLKLAVRKQLAGSCRRGRRERPFPGVASGGSPPALVAPQPQPNTARPSERKPAQRSQGERPTPRGPEGVPVETAGARDGRLVLLAVVLLLLTLGSGGWAARRAFTD